MCTRMRSHAENDINTDVPNLLSQEFQHDKNHGDAASAMSSSITDPSQTLNLNKLPLTFSPSLYYKAR